MQIGTTQNSKDLVAKIQVVNEQVLKIIAKTDKVYHEQDLEKTRVGSASPHKKTRRSHRGSKGAADDR
jgi:hypothetical protein